MESRNSGWLLLDYIYSMSRLLTVDRLHTVFPAERGDISAVKEVSFTVDRGETLGIVGESGSGKSVTSLSIMQLVGVPGRIAGGSVLFHPLTGVPIELASLGKEGIRKHRGKDLAMIFQEPMTSLNPVLSCGYQVAEALRLHLGLSKSEARKRSIELFEQVRSEDTRLNSSH